MFPATRPGACFVPLSHRISQTDLDYCIADCGASVVFRAPVDVEALVGGDHPGALELDDSAPSIQLYTSGTTGRPKGVPRSHRAERAGGLSQVLQHGLRVARQIKSGICHVNGPTVHDEAQMPFGGTKASGYGRFGGKAGIDAFTELRWITLETLPGHYPI